MADNEILVEVVNQGAYGEPSQPFGADGHNNISAVAVAFYWSIAGHVDITLYDDEDTEIWTQEFNLPYHGYQNLDRDLFIFDHLIEIDPGGTYHFHFTNYTGGMDNMGKTVYTNMPTEEISYWALGNYDYLIPKSIDCYYSDPNCSYGFVISQDVMTRSLQTESSSSPRFVWWWPNSLGTAIVSSTVQAYIKVWDDGTNPRQIMFPFPLATSTTEYVLEINDPEMPVRINYFVIDLNVLDKETTTFCDDPCYEVATSTIFGSINCGFRQFGCWLFVPDDEVFTGYNSSINNLKKHFPFSVFYGITGAFKDNIDLVQDTRTGVFSIPMYGNVSSSPTSTFYMMKVLDASSTENAIGKENANMFRNTFVYLFYILGAIYIIFRIWK